MRKRTSKEILAETLVDLSKTRPIEKITVKQIVNESGLSLQTFYNHFADKQELISFIHKNQIMKIFVQLEDNDMPFSDIFNDMTFFDGYYREFMKNAMDASGAQNLFIYQASSNVFDCLSKYVLEKSGMTELTPELQIYLKSYAWTINLMYEAWVNNSKLIGQDQLGKYILGCMPEGLKPYLK